MVLLRNVVCLGGGIVLLWVAGVFVAVRIVLGSLDLDSCGVIRYKFPV